MQYFNYDTLMDCSGLAGSAINILHNQTLHKASVANTIKRHEESVALATAQHEKDMKIAKQTYLMSAFTTLEQHFQQLNADLISSSKESESDMFDQRNQCFQTVILSATIMFSSLVTVIFQGFLPEKSDSFIFVSYSLTSALSFAFLFLSIVLCVEVLLRASSFMYNRATNHTEQLREAIQKTKTMMKKIRVGERSPSPKSLLRKSRSTDLNDTNSNIKNKSRDKTENNTMNNNTSTAVHNTNISNVTSPRKFLKKGNRQIAEMKEEDLQIEWERHEAEVHKYLEEREKINDQTSVLVSADANSSRMSFEQFWRESCKFWGDIAILFFYAGTANLLLAIMIYMWTEFFTAYDSVIGAVISVCIVGTGLIVGLCLYVLLRRNYNDRTHKAKIEQRRALFEYHDIDDDDSSHGRTFPDGHT